MTKCNSSSQLEIKKIIKKKKKKIVCCRLNVSGAYLEGGSSPCTFSKIGNCPYLRKKCPD